MKKRLNALIALVLTMCMISSSVFAAPMMAGTMDSAAESVVDNSNVETEATVSAEGMVAKVGDTEYATIDEAIAAWTNGKTLTLLADVTLSDVITLNSTEHHILNLGTYTMTAASGKNAFEIKACGTGDAERYAITINADAENPGGINAGNKSIVYYNYASGTATGNDRPIIKINNGVFTGSTSSWGTAGIYFKGSAARKAATLNIAGGTFNCSINGQGKSKLIISGGTFNYSVGSQGDSTANRLISGGTFKQFGFMTADSNNTKFWFGTSMANSNVGVYVDDNGYVVIGGSVITEAGDKFEASSSNYDAVSYLLQYSSAKTNGLYYTSFEEALADNNTESGSVTIHADEIDMAGIDYKGTIVVPEGKKLRIVNAPEGLIVDGDYEAVTYPATLNGKGYESLKAAIDTITTAGDYEIKLQGEIAEDVSFDKLKNVNIVIDGQNKTTFTGSIKWLDFGDSNTEDGLMTIKNIAFTTDKINHDFISSVTTNRYPQVLVEDCTFTGTGDIHSEGYAVVAVRLKSDHDSVIKNCTGTGLHSFLQNTAGWDLTLDNVDVTNSLSGFACGSVQGVNIKNCDLLTEESGIRLDAQYNNNAVIENCKVKAFIPVVVRKASVKSTVTFNGTNTMEETNTDGLWLAVGTSEYGENGTMPTPATAEVTVNLNDASLDRKGVYPSLSKGTVTVAYTKEVDGNVRVWGEGSGNAYESFVLKLFSGDVLVATTTLKNTDSHVIINGNVAVTWNFFWPSSNDDYWVTDWEHGHPNDRAIPTKVVLYVDGEKVAENIVKMCAPDDLNPVEWGNLGGVEEIFDLYISDAEGLKAFADTVNSGADNFAGKKVCLTADINLNGSETNLWTPIGKNGDAQPRFAGLFDGKGHTITGLYVKQDAAYHSAGLFGATNGTIKNFTIDGAYVESLSSGSATVNGTAVVAGSTVNGANIENVHVKNAIVKGNRYVAGIVGYMDGTVKNCSVENLTVIATPDNLTGSYDNGDKVGGIVGYTNSQATEISGCELLGDVSLTGYRDIGGIVGTVQSAVTVADNKNSGNVVITVDQKTNNYGDKATNAGEFVGRGTPSAESTDNERTVNASYGVVWMVKNDNVAFIDTDKDGVCDTDEVLYESLADALTAASAIDGAVTIEILNDVEWETGDGHGTTPLVPADSKAVVTINGNGNVLTATGAGVGSIRAANGEKLTFNDIEIVDNSVSYDENAWEFTYLEFAGVLEFNKVTFSDEIQIQTENGEAKANAVFNDCTFKSNESSVYALWICDGEVEINNCGFTGYRAVKVHEYYGSEVDSLKASGCTFDSIEKKPAFVFGNVDADTAITIENCVVKNATQAGDQGTYLYESDTDVTSFNFVTTENTVTDSEGTKLYPIATIGDAEFGEINAAFAVAKAGDTITLHNNAFGSATLGSAPAAGGASLMAESDAVVLDLNGYEWSSDGSAATLINYNNLVVKNGTITSTGVAVENHGTMVMTDVTVNGDVTSDSEWLEIEDCTVNGAISGKVKIHSGIFSEDPSAFLATSNTVAVKGADGKWTVHAARTLYLVPVYDDDKTVKTNEEFTVEAYVDGVSPKGVRWNLSYNTTYFELVSMTANQGYNHGTELKPEIIIAKGTMDITKPVATYVFKSKTLAVDDSPYVLSNVDIRTVENAWEETDVSGTITNKDTRISVINRTITPVVYDGGVEVTVNTIEVQHDLSKVFDIYVKAFEDSTELTDATITYTYKYAGTSQTLTELPDFSDVGLYQISYKIEKEGYTTVEGELTVNIKYNQYTVEVKFGGEDLTTDNKTISYTGDEYEFEVTSNPAAKITYKVNDGAATETAPVIKGVGTYTIEYTVEGSPSIGYEQVTKTVVITVNKPNYIVEVSFGEDTDYVFGTKLVLVHTDAKGVTFNFDGVKMYDVSDAGYCLYQTTTKFDYVYALVVDASIYGGKETDRADYENAVTLDYVNGADKINYVPNEDVNLNGTVTWNDIMSTYSVAERDEYAFKNQMAGFIKADTNRDKHATSADATDIISVVYKKN